MGGNGLFSVGGAAGVETAVVAKKRAQQGFIALDEKYRNVAHQEPWLEAIWD